jgi:hypothetical protein
MMAIQEVCAWCKTVTREGSLPATHGICPSCMEQVLRESGLDDADSSPADCSPVTGIDARD